MAHKEELQTEVSSLGETVVHIKLENLGISSILVTDVIKMTYKT